MTAETVVQGQCDVARKYGQPVVEVSRVDLEDVLAEVGRLRQRLAQAQAAALSALETHPPLVMRSVAQ